VSAALFTSGDFRAYELAEADIPRLQRFFDANPEYFLAISGEPAVPTEAYDEFQSMPPPDWPLGRTWSIGFDVGSELQGVATLAADMFAPGVWHVGLFMVAESRRGSGSALYRELEDWMRRQGAQWLRLGVVVGNDRAERFWRGQGFVEMRRREGFKKGARVSQLIVMAKALDEGTWHDYARLVPRDQPGAP
jgi:GNAT superfamily N-acetyltransferase